MDRSEVAARVRALLAKTVERGCTEHEALAAATKAFELINKHQLDMSAIELESEGVIRGLAEKAETRKLNVQSRLVAAVAEFCEVRGWLETEQRGQHSRVMFFGLKSDVEFANWLLRALERFVWQHADEYALKSGESDYLSKRNFCIACCERVNERLRHEVMLRRLKQAPTSSRKSLMIVKRALVEREFEKLGIHLAMRSYCCGGGGSANATQAGRAAGDRAGFGRPVHGGGKPKAIAKH
jgi:hypothetical protein